jgi:pentatricopeptide repeat protein
VSEQAAVGYEVCQNATAHALLHSAGSPLRVRVRVRVHAAGIKADERVFHNTLLSCSRSGQWQAAFRLLDRMPLEGLKPNAHVSGSCGSVVDGSCACLAASQ